MAIKTNRKLILTTVIGIVLLFNVVLAPPGIPHAFYGSVTYNGKPAPDGLTVVAKINGEEFGNTTTSDGSYGPYLYVKDPYNNNEGKTINFFVNGIDTGQTAVFQNGKITKLDLTATNQSISCTCTDWEVVIVSYNPTYRYGWISICVTGYRKRTCDPPRCDVTYRPFRICI